VADNFVTNSGSGGSTFSSDDIAGIHFPRLKLIHGVDGTNSGDVSSTNGLPVTAGGYQNRISQTPTISISPAYTAKDAIGGLLTFANAVRVSGGTGILQTVTIVDKGQQMASIDLVLFDQTFTAPTDNAIFAPTDAELANVIAVVPMSNYSDFSTNSVAARGALGIAFEAVGTSIFGALVSRGTPTYTSTTDIIVILGILQD